VIRPIPSAAVSILVSFALLPSLFADTVQLDNGSRLVGDVVSVRDGALTLKTDFAGDLSLDLKRVTSLRTDGPLRVALEGQPETVGTLAVEGTGVEVKGDAGTVQGMVANLKAAGPADQPLVDPQPVPQPEPRLWSYEVNAFYRGKSGNTDSTELGIGTKAERRTDLDRLKLYATWEQSEKNGTKTEDETIGGIDFERELSERYSWYTRAELERDDIEKLSLRATVAGGIGYYMIKSDVRELRFRTGLQYQRETYEDGGKDSSDIGMEFGLHHCWNIADWGKLVNDITYSAAFEDWADYRVVHESSLDVPLVRSKLWKLRLGLSHEYNSTPAPGTDELDTTYFLKLVFNWK
jgi:putative salt-induced outer membrane protein YdiY